MKIVQQSLPARMACCIGECVLKGIKDAEEPSVDQLVLLRPCRGTVLKLAHNIPASGHLGRRKNLRKIQQRFFWPGMTRDVAEYCRCCEVCQKLGGKARGQRSPMVHILVVEEPFQRVAMDIVEPLDRAESGNKNILVICDYGTRYPEAVRAIEKDRCYPCCRGTVEAVFSGRNS